MRIIRFLSEPFGQQLGLTLVHFLWQGLAVAVLVVAIVRLLRLRPGNICYTVYLVAFATMTVCPLLTFIALDRPAGVEFAPPARLSVSGTPAVGAIVDMAPTGDAAAERTIAVERPTAGAERVSKTRLPEVWLPRAVGLWMVGVFVLSVRLLLGFVGVWRCRRDLRPLPEELIGRVAQLSAGLGLPRFSRVFISPAVLQAMAIGYLRPMVLLPAAMLTRMDASMIEAVVAHELAHIRRLDLWINLAQRIVETLLFYHPAVWWLSNRLRAEREFCCDEMAVAVTGERLTYATALETAQRGCLTAEQPALAVSLGRGRRCTLGRVRHILGLPPVPSDSRFWLAGAIVVAILAILALPTASLLTAQAEGKTIESDETPTFELFEAAADGSIHMNAIGRDIWDTTDEFGYAYKNLTGDGSMIARVDDLDGAPSAWAKAGAMVRQSTAAGSVHSFTCMTGGNGNGAEWQGRETDNGTSVNTDATDPLAPPYWVRIDRTGDSLTGYLSPDGEHWTQLGDPRYISMNDPVLIGLAVTSHNTAMATSVTFSKVSFTGAVSGEWQRVEVGGLPRAVAKGDIAQIKALIAGGADVNLRDSTAKTALNHAVENGDLEVAELLIEHGADVNYHPHGGWGAVGVSDTPLHTAAFRGDAKMAKLLIDKGANVHTVCGTAGFATTPLDRILLGAMAKIKNERPNARFADEPDARVALGKLLRNRRAAAEVLLSAGADVDRLSSSALAVLARGDGCEMAELLFEYGLSPNCAVYPAYNCTLLHVTARFGSTSMVELLTAKGADVSVEDGDGLTPLWYARNGGHVEIVELLLKRGARDDAPPTALFAAARAGNAETVNMLIERGADVNATDDWNRTPLYLAAARGHTAVTELLLNSGANPNVRSDTSETTALIAATDNRHDDIASLLVANDADIDAKGKDGQTALHCAARQNNVAIGRMLLAAGAEREARCQGGETPLAWAAYQGRAEFAKLLIEHGADIEAPLPDRQTTPLWHAVSQGHIDTAKVLLAGGAKTDTNLSGRTLVHVAMQRNHSDMVRVLLREGVKVASIRKAAYFGDLDTVRILVREGGANAKDDAGYTPLHCALCGGHEEIVRFLLSEGADVNAKTTDGLTPLCFARTADAAALLLAASANPNGSPTTSGHTALHAAIDRGDVRIVELLLSHGADANAKVSGGDQRREDWTPLHVACTIGDKAIVTELLAKGAYANARTAKGDTPISLAKGNGHREVCNLLVQHAVKSFVSTKPKQVTHGASVLEGAAFKFPIPEKNQEIPEHMQACAANLQKIYAAIARYEKDNDKLPDWLSDLVPEYLSKEMLLCPQNPVHNDRYAAGSQDAL